MSELKFLGKIIITSKIKLLTGLHIGGTIESFEIGGMDNPVIRDPVMNLPYIPGSSLKGKMRAELEWALKKINPDGSVSNEKEITLIFGKAVNNKEKNNENDKNLVTGRLIVRDAYPEGYYNLDFSKPLEAQDKEKLSDTLKMWLKIESGLPYTEWKTENSLNRITSSATPRSIERVPAGSVFDLEMIYTLYDENDIEGLKNLDKAIKLLEDSYLGGSGTRGYGKIKFEEKKYIYKSKEFYLKNEEAKEFDSLDSLKKVI